MASQRRAGVLSKVGTTIMVSMFSVSCTAPIANWPASYDSNTGAGSFPSSFGQALSGMASA